MATSIKSVDLNAATYQNTGALVSRLAAYIDKVAVFQGANYGGRVITATQITERALEIAIPAGATAAQQIVIQAMVQYGQSVGVTVTTIVF